MLHQCLSSSQFSDWLTASSRVYIICSHTHICSRSLIQSLWISSLLFSKLPIVSSSHTIPEDNCCRHVAINYYSLSPNFSFLPVVLCFGETQHGQCVQPGLVCRWHTAGRGLRQWACHFCPCGGAALGVEELPDHPHQEENHAGITGESSGSGLSLVSSAQVWITLILCKPRESSTFQVWEERASSMWSLPG